MAKRWRAFQTEIINMLNEEPWVGYAFKPPDSPAFPGQRFTLDNPIDILGCMGAHSFCPGKALYVECKTTKPPSLSYKRLRESQWGALMKCYQSQSIVYIALNRYGHVSGTRGKRGEAWLIPFDNFIHNLTDERKSWPLAKLLDDSQSYYPVVSLRKVAGGWEFPEDVRSCFNSVLHSSRSSHNPGRLC